MEFANYRPTSAPISTPQARNEPHTPLSSPVKSPASHIKGLVQEIAILEALKAQAVADDQMTLIASFEKKIEDCRSAIAFSQKLNRMFDDTKKEEEEVVIDFD